MRVKVEVYGMPAAGRRCLFLELPPRATAGEAAAALGCGPEVLLVVNGVVVPPGEPLRDGDRVEVFPPLAGG